MGQIGSKSGVFKVFQLFLKIGSKDFCDFLPKVSGQYRLTTGENRLFPKILNFGPGGQKGPKNHRTSDAADPEMVIFFIHFLLKITQFAKKKAIIFFFGPF